MSELWLGRCVANKTIPSLRQRRGIGEIAPVNILNNLNNNQEQGSLRNRSVELDTPDCNLSSLSVSDSDSLFLEDVDEETNFVQMAVTTLTKHNLLLIEKLQSAKYYDYERTEPSLETKQSNVSELTESLNILPQMNDSEMKCAKEKLPMVAYNDTEVYLLRNENSRLKGALAEFRGQSLALHKQIETLKTLLAKNEQVNCSQQKRFERLEQQIYSLGISQRRQQDPVNSDSDSPSIKNHHLDTTSPQFNLPESPSSRLNVVDSPTSRLSLPDSPGRHNLADPSCGNTRARSLSECGRSPRASPVYRSKRLSHGQRYDTRYKPRRCMRDVSITFTGFRGMRSCRSYKRKKNKRERLYATSEIDQTLADQLFTPSKIEQSLADRLFAGSENEQSLAERLFATSELEQNLIDRLFATSDTDHSLVDRLFPTTPAEPSDNLTPVIEDDCFADLLSSPDGCLADRLFLELIPDCAVLCYDSFYQERSEKQEEGGPVRSPFQGVDYLIWETPQLGPHKVILVGDSGVGKSSFMLRLCDDAFNEKMNPSFGLDFKTKVISVNGTEENIQIWDTAGQERFRSITQSYFRKVDGIILVYDITHEESFLNLQNWVTCIQESGQLSAPMTIIGNKLDLEHLRCVSREMATELANFYEADFVEVSAKDGRNINQLGYDLVSKLVERRAVNTRQADSSFPVTRPPTKEYSEASCCVIL
ncbi:uncharacterized protein LOC134819725 isoform X1 [Bolinopsis microptera]|uniref:uncharacterized protein LOC134819725 isoform X1 n=1 Tax=Bolinopsis microptera TaxID=2820187 RepID=UPI003079A16B